MHKFHRSLGVSAFEERGEINGLFVKHLKKHLGKRESIVQILNLTFQGCITSYLTFLFFPINLFHLIIFKILFQN